MKRIIAAIVLATGVTAGLIGSAAPANAQPICPGRKDGNAVSGCTNDRDADALAYDLRIVWPNITPAQAEDVALDVCAERLNGVSYQALYQRIHQDTGLNLNYAGRVVTTSSWHYCFEVMDWRS